MFLAAVFDLTFFETYLIKSVFNKHGLQVSEYINFQLSMFMDRLVGFTVSL